MKTRRKTPKTPVNGAKSRRSSVICVKKSPINRRPNRRMLRSNSKALNTPTFQYESPIQFTLNNGSGSSSIRSKKRAAGPPKIEEEIEVEDDTEVKLSDISSLSLKDEQGDQIDERKPIHENKANEDSNLANSSTERTTSKRKSKVDMLTALQNRKKRKTLKKSPLSRFNEPDVNLCESIIILDDSESLPDTKAVLTESKRNTNVTNIDQSIVKLEPLSNFESNNDEVEVIDCDSSLMEMEAYHAAFNENGKCSPLISNASWSPPNINENLSPVSSKGSLSPVSSDENLSPAIANENLSPDNNIIEILDDDSPIHTTYTSPILSGKYFTPIQRPATPKTNDDCFVVWSSLPVPSTSNSDPQEPSTSFTSNNLNIMKHKIYLDTTPDMDNLKCLNNENDKPKRSVKSTRDTAKPKKSLLKSPKATKTATKTIKAGTKTVKTANKITKAVTTFKTATATTKTATTKIATAAIKTATATTKTEAATKKPAVKKRTKNKGELIFLSESQEDGSGKKTKSKKGKLREIVIDGSNVAMAYTHNKMFSEKGIKMLIDYFTKRGHSVKVFVPQYRRSRNFPLLEKWYTEGIVVFTPSRKLGNKTFTPYDDRYILEYATARNGIVVSQDQFRDLYAEKPEYRDTIENRILVPTFVGDYVMFPEDPLGRDGPTLSDFLKY